ncbi:MULTISPECIES: hypothetical protein [unclassified Bradyrhizobium]|uniref:hypothetical protein n=1 Tax=unclassified Bradyrhizobium TaxID=2631580 RepID=UPI00211E5332|nr:MULTISPECIES: hypothetical protein [unclassified Bradyrhizobium]
MRHQTLTFVQKAQAAWGDPLPDWIEAIARDADLVGAKSVSRTLGYSPGIVSAVLRNKYPNTQDVEAAARASLGNGRLWTKVPAAAPQAPQRHPGTFVEKAKGAWGDPLPDWIQALAEEADRIKLAGIARKLDYSQAAISTVLSKKYAGDVARIEGKVRGFLLGAKVMCPVYGEIGRDQCLDLQKVQPPFSSEASSRCYRCCRGLGGIAKCPNSRIPDGQR